MCSLNDFVWIDTEHNPMSLETVQAHIMATKGSDVAAIVRVGWNDPVLIKPILDTGADGIIVPLVCSVARCSGPWPPASTRRRACAGPTALAPRLRLWPSGPDYCRHANNTLLIMAQIEHIDAARNRIHGILAVPGLTGIVLGPQRLAGSMGYMGQPTHPEVVKVMEHVISAARRAGLYAGQSIGGGPEVQASWVQRGVQWMSIGNDMGFLLAGAHQMVGGIRDLVSRPAAAGAAQ